MKCRPTGYCGRSICLAWCLCLAGLLFADRAGAYDGGDELYDALEFGRGSVGAVFFGGDFKGRFDTALFFSVEAGVRLVSGLSLVPSLGLGVTRESGVVSREATYVDGQMRLRWRWLAPEKRIVPFTEAGLGWTDVADGDFQLVGAVGLDLLVWKSGGIGVKSSFQRVLSGSAFAVPVLFTFVRYF